MLYLIAHFFNRCMYFDIILSAIQLWRFYRLFNQNYIFIYCLCFAVHFYCAVWKITLYGGEDRMNDEWWTENDVEDTSRDLSEVITRNFLRGTKYNSEQFLNDNRFEYKLELCRYVNLTSYTYTLTVSHCVLCVHFCLLHLKIYSEFCLKIQSVPRSKHTPSRL
jgi:hypothetical protein